MATFSTPEEEERQKKIEFARKRLEMYRESTNKGIKMGLQNGQNPADSRNLPPQTIQYGQAPDSPWQETPALEANRPNIDPPNSSLSRYPPYQQGYPAGTRPGDFNSQLHPQQMQYSEPPIQMPSDNHQALNSQKISNKLGGFFSRFLNGGNSGNSTPPGTNQGFVPPSTQQMHHSGNYAPTNMPIPQQPVPYGGQIQSHSPKPTYYQLNQQMGPSFNPNSYHHEVQQGNFNHPQTQNQRLDTGMTSNFNADNSFFPQSNNNFNPSNPDQDSGLHPPPPNTYNNWQSQPPNPPTLPRPDLQNIPLAQNNLKYNSPPQLTERLHVIATTSSADFDYISAPKKTDQPLSYTKPSEHDQLMPNVSEYPSIRPTQNTQAPEPKWNALPYMNDVTEAGNRDYVPPPEQNINHPPMQLQLDAPQKLQSNTINYNKPPLNAVSQANVDTLNMHQQHDTYGDRPSYQTPPAFNTDSHKLNASAYDPPSFGNSQGSHESQKFGNQPYNPISLINSQNSHEHEAFSTNAPQISSHDLNQIQSPVVTSAQNNQYFFGAQNVQPELATVVNAESPRNPDLPPSNRVEGFNGYRPNSHDNYFRPNTQDDYNTNAHDVHDSDQAAPHHELENPQAQNLHLHPEDSVPIIGEAGPYLPNDLLPSSAIKPQPQLVSPIIDHQPPNKHNIDDLPQETSSLEKNYLQILKRMDKLENLLGRLISDEPKDTSYTHEGSGKHNNDRSSVNMREQDLSYSGAIQYLQNMVPASEKKKLSLLEKEVMHMYNMFTGRHIKLGGYTENVASDHHYDVMNTSGSRYGTTTSMKGENLNSGEADLIITSGSLGSDNKSLTQTNGPCKYVIDFKEAEKLFKFIINLYNDNHSKNLKIYEATNEHQMISEVPLSVTNSAQNASIGPRLMNSRPLNTEDATKYHNFGQEPPVLDTLDKGQQHRTSRTQSQTKEDNTNYNINDKTDNKPDSAQSCGGPSKSHFTEEHLDTDYPVGTAYKDDNTDFHRMLPNAIPDFLINRKTSIKMKLDGIKEKFGECNNYDDKGNHTVDNSNSVLKNNGNDRSESYKRDFL